VINAGGPWTGDTTYSTASGCFVRPLRALAAATAVYYNATTFELSYLTSSVTTKNTIQDMTMDTNMVYVLSPKTYYYNSDPNAGIQIGYIAEDVQSLNSQFATYDMPNGNPVAINYNAVVVFMMEEIRKLRTRIEQLETKI
jgi:hypothetical protein